MTPPGADKLSLSCPFVGVLRRRRARTVRWLGAAAVAAAVLGAGPCDGAARSLLGGNLWWVVLAALCVGAAALVRALDLGLFADEAPGTFTADEHAVTLEWGPKSLRVPRAQITEGWIVALHGHQRVELTTRGGDVLRAWTATPAAARDVLAAVGLGAAQHTVEATTRPSALRPLALMATTVAIALAALSVKVWPESVGGFQTMVLALGALAALAAVHRALGSRRVVVGADGVRVGEFAGPRFVPFVRVAAVTADYQNVTLTLVDGERVRIATRDPSGVTAAALRTRIDDALAAARARLPSLDLALLDQGGRSHAAWLAALRGLIGPEAGYRGLQVTPEAVARVLDDPAAPARRRVAAAVALAATSATDDRARIRVAAAACADEPVRAALERVLRDEDPDPDGWDAPRVAPARAATRS